MYCRALVCDLDGTGAGNGQLFLEVAAALAAARAQGFVTMLATGRVFAEVQALCPDLSVFDAVVAENGAIVWLPARQRTIQLGQPPPQEFLGALQARGIPFHVGAVVVGTWEQHAGAVLSLARQFAIDVQLIFNRGAMMLLPSSVNKATGVQRALEELGRSECNMVVFGDAENDLPMFAIAGVAVAPRGSVATVAAKADVRLSQPGGTGLAEYIFKLVEQGGMVPTPERHGVILGYGDDGSPAVLPASGTNLMITGDPRSGKSWLAGLVAEQFLDRGFRVCMIDPEGGNVGLAERPRVLGLGTDLPLPEPSMVPRLLRNEAISIVLDIAGLSQPAQMRYVAALLPELARVCAATGMPHWIVIEEAQYFFHESSSSLRALEGAANFVLVTYRPSLIALSVYGLVGAHVITPTLVEEERYFITSLLQARGPRDLVAGDALREIGPRRAGLLIEDPVRPRWQIFTPQPRLTVHTHHARKYAETRLSEDKGFRFVNANGSGLVARNVIEFHHAVRSVPLASLRHHLNAGDFSRWVTEVLGDERLARSLLKLELAARHGGKIDRGEILTYIEDNYLIESEPKGSGAS
jgi:hydroxymethylpyrimidine pyrophosphatase-like HAD family hydrolase